MIPIDPSTAVRGAMGAGQLIYGLLNKPGERPKMTTPGAVEEATARSRNRANASTDEILQSQKRNIDQSSANAISNVKRSAGNASDVISGLTEVSGRATQATNSARDSFGQRKMQYEGQLQNNLNTEAAYDRQNFQYNKIAPFEESVTARNQLIQAGLGNLTDATDMQNTMNIINGRYGNPQAADNRPQYAVTDQIRSKTPKLWRSFLDK